LLADDEDFEFSNKGFFESIKQKVENAEDNEFD
jgi:hypothetical protein